MAVVYVALVAAAAPALISGVSDVGTAVALAGITLSLGVTAAVAAPLHGRLSHGRDGGLVRSLRLADLVRTLGACVAVSGAVLAAL